MFGWNLIGIPAVVPSNRRDTDGVVIQTSGCKLAHRVTVSLIVIEPTATLRAPPWAVSKYSCGGNSSQRWWAKLSPGGRPSMTPPGGVTSPRQDRSWLPTDWPARSLAYPGGVGPQRRVEEGIHQPGVRPGKQGRAVAGGHGRREGSTSVGVPGAGSGRTPNSSKRSICWLKSNAPNSGLAGRSLGMLAPRRHCSSQPCRSRWLQSSRPG